MKLAALVTIVGLFVAAVGVGLYDYRAGLVLLGLAAAAVGFWTLTSQE